MKKILLLVHVLLLSGWVVGFLPGVSFPADDGALRVGEIKLKKVFDNFPKVKDAEKLLQKEKEQKYREIEDIKAQIKKLQNEIDSLPSNSVAIKEKEKEVAQLQETLQSRLKEWNEYVKQKVDIITLDFYREIKEQVGAFAMQNGYDLILKTDAKDKLDEIALQRATEVFAYRNKNVAMTDITEDIIKLLNKKDKAAEPGVSGERFKLKIGGINVRKLVEDYRKSNQLEKFEETKALFEKELQGIELAIKYIQKEIDLLPEDSVLRKEKEAILVKLEDERWKCSEVIGYCAKQLRAPYNKIKKAVKTFAEKNGYDLILNIETPDIADSVTLRITKEGITYRNENVFITDITDTIMPWVLR